MMRILSDQTLMLLCGLLLLQLLTTISSKAQAPKGETILYPAPYGEAISSDYWVYVNGQSNSLPIYMGYSLADTSGNYSFAYFDFSGSVDIKIYSVRPLGKVQILPHSAGIKPVITKDHVVEFTLTKPCKLSIEPDGKFAPLLLFANAIEKNPPKEGDAGVKYFGPGIHECGAIELNSDETLYIAGGAVVRGGIRATGNNIKVLGHGILDNSVYAHFKGPTGYTVAINKCINFSLDGIIIRGSSSWTVVPQNSNQVTIKDIKLCGGKNGNDDGIDICNSQNVTITDSFLRCWDDNIAVKGWRDPTKAPISNLTITNCIFWSDFANTFRLGTEGQAESMRNFTITDCDVIHYTNIPDHYAFHLMPAEECPMSDVRFENIRINGEGQQDGGFIELFPGHTHWSRPPGDGIISHVVFKNITVEGAPGPYIIRVIGCDAKHSVSDVTFENVVIRGMVLSDKYPNLTNGPFTTDIIFLSEK